MRTKADLWEIEKEISEARGEKLFCGIDEAGRGPLCGPVCAAAVVLPFGLEIEGLDDSKKLSEKKREMLYDIIAKESLSWSVAFASEKEIDEVNILNATFLAIKRAVKGLEVKPEFVLIDGNRSPKLDIPLKTIVKGDSKSANIAAASIMAKVSRDRYMRKLSVKYPEYLLEKHKGYPTKEHYEILRRYGVKDFYRMSFLKNLEEHYER